MLGGAQVLSGVGAFPPEQIGQRGRAGAVAALAERAASFEIGERGHTGLIEGATHALAEGQHPEQIGLARRLARGIPQHVDRLAEQAARDFQRAFRHLSIVSEQMFDQVLLGSDVCGDVGELLHRLAGHRDGEDIGDDLAPTVHEVAPAVLDEQLAGALLGPACCRNSSEPR